MLCFREAWMYHCSITTAFVVFLCLILLGCAGRTAGPGAEAPGGGAPAVGAGQPPWPEAQVSSVLTETRLDGVSVHAKSAGAVEQGAALELGSVEASCEWAIYRFNPGTDALDSVAVLLDVPAGSAAWIGLADYAKEHWCFSGPYTTSKTLAVDDACYRSSAGELYLSVVVYGGNSAAVRSLSVRTVKPDNEVPWADLAANPLTGDTTLDVEFDASGSIDPDGEIRYYMWDFDGDGNFEGTTFTSATSHAYTMPGVFTAQVAVVDDCGAWGVDSVAIEIGVAGNSAPTADLAATPDTGDTPLNVTFDASGSSDPDGSIKRYDWDFDGDGNYELYDGGAAPSHIYTAAGSFSAKVRVTDDAGAQDAGAVTITVNVPGNDLPVADLAVDQDRPLTGQMVTFDASGSSDPDGSIVLYEWDFDGDGAWDASGTTATATHSYAVQYGYVAQVRVTDNVGAQDTAQLQLAAAHGPWTGCGHDTLHSGRSPYIGAQTNTLKWTYTTGGYVHSSPAIGADGTVYVGNYDYKLYAINPGGTLKWSYTTGGLVNSCPAIGADGTVYVGSGDNKLYAINLDGTLKWAYTTGDMVLSSPVIGADGTVYVGSLDTKLYAINPDGTLKWTYTAVNNVYSSPAIGADGTVYVGNKDSKLYAINPDGSLKWAYTTGASVFSSPAIGADGTVYVGSGDNKLHAINPDGSLKWTYTTGSYVSSPAIGADGTVYVGSWDFKLYAINPDGTLKWSYTTGSSVNSSPAIGADGTVYVGSDDCKLRAINPDGSLNWAYTTGGNVYSSPAIGANGTVYVGSYDNKLYAIGP